MKHTTIFKKMFAAFSAAAVAASCVSLTAFAEGEMYTWTAGEYWVEPGGELAISPTVSNCPGDLMTIGFDFDEAPLFGSGAVVLSQYGETDGELGEAYPSFTNMYFNVPKLHAGGTDKDNGEKGVAAAADGSVIGYMYMNVADEAAVKAAAESLGLELQEDAEHGTYYAFPLNFDPSVDPDKESPKCEAVNIKEEYTEINYVDGHVNIMVEGVVESDAYTVFMSVQAGGESIWEPAETNVAAVEEDGTYEMSYTFVNGSASIEALIIDSNINAYDYAPEGCTDPIAEGSLAMTIDKITLTRTDGTVEEIAYNGPSDSAFRTGDDGSSVRYNILNTWTTPQVADIDSALPGAGANEGDVITVTFTITGLNESPFSEINYGDADEDGVVGLSDATAILTEYANTAAGLGSGMTESQFTAADVDADGAITLADASAVLGYYAANAAGLNPDVAEFFPAAAK